MVYVEPRQGKWIGRYRVDGKLKSTPVFTSKRAAEREAQALEAAGKRSEWLDPKAGSMTLAEYFTLWQEGRTDRAARTAQTERERFDSLIAPTFGKTPLKRLSYDEIARWAATMRGKRSGQLASQARRRDAARLLVAILDAAVDAQRLRTNPARSRSGRVPYLPKQSKTKEHRYLNEEQLRRVAEAANSEQATCLILLAGLTGLRWGEVSALTVADMNPLARRISVRRAYTRLDDGTLLLGDTKTHARREVPLLDVLKAEVAGQMAGKRKTDLIFATANGDPLRRESFARNSFEPAVQAAGNAVSALQRLLWFGEGAVSGVYDPSTEAAVRQVQVEHQLPVTGVCDPSTWKAIASEDRNRRSHAAPDPRDTTAEGGRSIRGASISRARQLNTLGRMTLRPGVQDFDRLTLHDLRHTAASIAIANGGSPKEVQAMLGHESAKVTLDTYAGLFESHLDALGDRMSRAFATASVASPAHYPLTTDGSDVASVTTMGHRYVG